jgi:hypothetical protein
LGSADFCLLSVAFGFCLGVRVCEVKVKVTAAERRRRIAAAAAAAAGKHAAARLGKRRKEWQHAARSIRAARILGARG